MTLLGKLCYIILTSTTASIIMSIHVYIMITLSLSSLLLSISLMLRCVGLSFQNFNPAHKEFTPVVLPNVSHNAYMQQQTRDSSTDEADDDNISMVLTHLLGHQNKGEMDIVPRLVKHCEELVKVRVHLWAYFSTNEPYHYEHTYITPL